MTSWRLLDNFLALLQCSWSIGKDQDFFFVLEISSSVWHYVTLLDMSWCFLAASQQFIDVFLFASWWVLCRLADSWKKKKSVRNKQEVVAKSQVESRTCQDSAKKPWRIPHTTYFYVCVSGLHCTERDESLRLAWFVSGRQVPLLSETQIHTNNYFT